MADPTGLSSEGAGAGVAEVDACSLEIERKYDVIPAVICSMCCLFGIIYCFFGEGSCTLTDFNIKQAKMFLRCHNWQIQITHSLYYLSSAYV